VNILIRPLTLEDAATSYKWRNDPEIWRFTGARPSKEITERTEREWLANSLMDKTKSRFAILVDGVYVGNVQLTDIIPQQSAEFHIFIGEKTVWGKGVAKEATSQILTYAKEVLKLPSVYLEVNKDNIAAIKAYEKNGFVTVGETNGSIRMICDIDI
jgi:RimJ/RimL family protein N-acetyltransferase